MATVALTTVGCRLNRYETEKIADELKSMGLDRGKFNQTADLYVLNTCTVTGKADADCRKLISRANRCNPEAIMVVTGCYVAAEKELIAEMNGVDLVVGNDRKMELPGIVKAQFPQLFQSTQSVDYHLDETGSQFNSHPPNRPMVQIGTGCNQHCTYCIVPKVRGGLISFRANMIISEINDLVQAGYHEVVLTAVHIGKYKDINLRLGKLVAKIIKETRIDRIRLSSLEPNELDEELLDFAANHDRVCRYLHLPLQSGSDRILKAMKRPYTRAEYLDTIERVKKANEFITIGCDVIAGFPGETDDDFADTLSVLSSGQVDYGHIFSYSDRPGTPASSIPEKNSVLVIKDRSRQARSICEDNRITLYKKQIGRRLEVISVGTTARDGLYRAVSDNYVKVKLPQFVGGGKEILSLLPETLDGDCLTGKIA